MRTNENRHRGRSICRWLGYLEDRWKSGTKQSKMLSDSDRILVDRRWLINDSYRENNLSFHREGKRRIVDDIRWRKLLSDYSGQIGISYATEIVEEMLKIDLRRLSILEISEIVGEGIREFLEKLKELSSCWKRRGLWIIS